MKPSAKELLVSDVPGPRWRGLADKAAKWGKNVVLEEVERRKDPATERAGIAQVAQKFVREEGERQKEL